MWLHKIIDKIKCKLSICCNSKCAYNTDLDEIIDDILHPECSATLEEALRDKHYNYLDCPKGRDPTGKGQCNSLEILGKYKTDI